MKSRLLGALCFMVLCVTLSLGLWPFHSPENDVSWLKDANGVVFGKYGTVMSSDVLKPASLKESDSGSIEIWVSSVHWTDSATLLSLYRAESGSLVALRQSLSDLEVYSEARTAAGDKIKNHFYVGDALPMAARQRKPVLITVTSGLRGTRVYLDGILAKVAPQFRIGAEAITGRVILGDAPKQPDSFQGQIRGLAIYESELNSSQVLLHYNTWTDNGLPDVSQEERNVVLYMFDEHRGDRICDHANGVHCDLHIPKNYMVVDKLLLEPFWKEFNLSWGYWSGNFKNVIGFVPFGFCFFFYLKIARGVRRAMLMTVILGAFMSLTIEVLQAFLPTRDSGTTDLITNTLGTYLGAICCENAYPILAKLYSRKWLQRQ